TTALCKALAAHPQILMGTPEAPLHHHLGEIAFEYEYGRIKEYYNYSIKIPSNQFRGSLKELCFRSVWGNDFGLKFSLKKSIRGRSERSIRYWGAKSFPNRMESIGLSWLFPNSKYIYLFRNGIEVVNSMMKFDAFKDLTFEEKCEFWAQRIFRYQYLVKDTRAITIRFEDLVDKPNEVLERVFVHLGLPLNQGSVSYLTENVVHPLDEGDQLANPQKIFKKRPPAHSSWTDNQKSAYKRICTNAMNEAGYSIPF
ncbi:MAG: sulfotransferase, partial [Cyclobacteriaceae bacterium]|nr:sulfotransferase [Cyclobacteriaceae bacterium]